MIVQGRLQFHFARLLLATGLILVVAVSSVSADNSKVPSSLPQPMRLIFDTDMGNDIDDALALGVIQAFIAQKECQLLAVTVSKDNPLAARFCDLINVFYGYDGRAAVPVGLVRNGKTPEDGTFLPGVVNATDRGQARYPQVTRNPQPGAQQLAVRSDDDFPDATQLLRKTLAAQPDLSVTLVVVGFSTNIARLLETTPDDISPLDGRALVEQKVALLSMMAGRFGSNGPKDFKEYNIKIDLEASTAVFKDWPTPIVVSGFEIGEAIPYPATSIERDFNSAEHHPLKEAYELYMKMPYDRPTWDLTSVLYAVRPDRGYFGISETGEISVVDGGVTVFKPGGHGRHRYLTVTPEQITRATEALVMLASEPQRLRIYKYTMIEAPPGTKKTNDK